MTALATPPAPLRPAVPLGPQPYRWTLETYRKLNLTGLFHDKKTMLIRGVFYVMGMPDPPHNTSFLLTQQWLLRVCPPNHHARGQFAFDIGADTDPGPDLAVVPGSIRDYANRQATAAVLVVEVADSSVFMDTTTKAELYATAGVPDYWVIDLPARKLVVFRNPAPIPDGGAAYRAKTEYAETDTVAPLAAPHAAVRVADLLP